MEYEKWGRRIRAFRKLKGYTQKGLAEEMGVSVSVLGALERGTREPSKKHLMEIADILNIPIEELIPEEETLE